MAIHVSVVYSSAPRQLQEWALQMPEGSTLLQALEASGLAAAFPEVDLGTAVAGIWGRKAGMTQLLREGDRVEVYRPLQVDPKVARRERFRAQGARTAGLFAKKRTGAKDGY
jgi:putative ubiquitin-RnfH superfamily antitoxin RatB of RatAB toxin-antitoxin module